MQIAERESGRRAQSEGQRGSDAIAPALGDISSRELRIVPHQVQPEGGATSQRGQRPIEVGGDALGLVRAQVHGPGEERGRLWGFGFLIDHAAGGTPAERDRRRALQDRDLLQVKRIAIVTAKVAHAVEENIVAGGEAANRQVVALGAAFSGGDADAGHIAQRVAQRGRALVLQ